MVESRTPDEQRIDEALEQSFPASDPPFYVGSGNKPSGTKRPKKKGGNFGYTASIPIRE